MNIRFLIISTLVLSSFSVLGQQQRQSTTHDTRLYTVTFKNSIGRQKTYRVTEEKLSEIEDLIERRDEEVCFECQGSQQEYDTSRGYFRQQQQQQQVGW